MNKIIDALKLAENTLEDIIRVYKFETGTPVTTLAAIREALAEQDKQEPIGWTNASNLVDDGYGHVFSVHSSEPAYDDWVPVYTAPVFAKREWVDLTDDELKAALEVHQVGLSVRIGRIAIAAFKEKNNV